MQIAAACIVKGPNGIAPGCRQIVKVILQIRVDRGINILAATAEVQHARARNGHLRLCVTADAFEVAKIFQHRMIAEAQFARYAHAVGFGLHPVELNALLRIITLYAL